MFFKLWEEWAKSGYCRLRKRCNFIFKHFISLRVKVLYLQQDKQLTLESR